MRLLIITFAGLGMVAAVPVSAQVNGHEDHQRDRIVQACRSGELTGRETAHLGRQQYRIARSEVHMRADGGGLSAREHVRLDARQDQASARIYGMKQNRRDRW